MRRTALTALLLLAPGLAAAPALGQGLRSGPNEPALSAQPPPSLTPNEGGDRSGAEPGDPNRRRDDPGRRAPPADHRVLGGPPVPGAQQPSASQGYATGTNPIPERPGNRPDASTTGR
jgi:hypothetical protein